MDAVPITPPDIRPWWVVFAPSSSRGWWSRFAPGEWGHCYVFTELPGSRQPVLVNPGMEYLDVRFPTDSRTLVQSALDGGARVVFVELGAPRGYTLPRRFLLMTCATVVAYVMGLDTYAFTPRQLYRHLLNIGGTDISEVQDG